MKTDWFKTHAAISLCALWWLLVFCQLVIFFKILGFWTVPEMIGFAISGSLLIVLPSILLPARFRWIFLVWFALVTFLLNVEIDYLHYFHDLPTLDTLSDPSNLNTFTIKSGFAIFSLRNVALILPWIISFLPWLFLRKPAKRERFSLPAKFICSGIVVICLLLSQLIQYHKFFQAVENPEKSGVFRKDFESYVFGGQPWDANITNVHNQGFVESLLIDLIFKRTPRVALTDAEKEEIVTRLSIPLTGKAADFPDYKGSNLIMIIVESWASTTIGAEIEGVEITPFANKLLRDSSVVFLPNVRDIITAGRSASGQLLYNTGLLPLWSEPFTQRYASGDFPSIAKALGKEYTSEEYIGESGGIWKHFDTSKSYGFSKLNDKLSHSSLGSEGILEADSMIFNAAAIDIEKLKRPFFALVTTLSTHGPYEHLPEHKAFSGKGLTPEEHSYVEAVHIFDRVLEQFFAKLSTAGLLKNTVVAIVADHSPEAKLPNLKNYPSDRIPLLIVPPENGKKGNLSRLREISSKPALSTVVYPSLLDIMGVLDTYPYKGFGKSLFRQSSFTDSILSPELPGDRELGAKILKSQYTPFPTQR